MDKPTFEHPQPQSNEPIAGQVYGQSQQEQLATQFAALQSQIDQINNKRINLNTDIIGLFETVTVAPTGVPSGPWQQIKISVIAGTTALNVYDATNHVWKKVTIT